MPRTSINYQNTTIYKIVCNDLNIKDIYVGHTTDFTRRMSQHKSSCKIITNNSHNLKIYQSIRINGGWNNWSMLEIEKYPCNDSNEASSRERYWYEILNANLNTHNPNRSIKEWFELHKDERKDYSKNLYEQNKTDINIKHRQYYNDNKEKIIIQTKEYYKNNKALISEKYKVIYMETKEKKIQYQKEYIEKNKDKILEYRKQKITCECGSIYRISNKSHHVKTIKHLNFLESQQL